jgi:hypothetical protein
VYIIGGYAFSPNELCNFFQARGVTLTSPGLGVQATRALEWDGHPYMVKSCMIEDEHVFVFVTAYRPIAISTRSFRFEETEAACNMKSELKLDGARFVTAVY